MIGLFLAGLLVITISNIWMNVRLVEMGNRMSYLQDTSDVIQSDLGALQSNLEKTLRKESSILEDYEVKVEKTDLKKGVYQLRVTAIPKEYTEKTKLTMYFGVKDYAMKKDGYRYSAKVTLPLTESYDGNVTVLITNGEKKKTEILRDYEGYPTTLANTLTGKLKGEKPVYEKGLFSYEGEADFSLLSGELDRVREFDSLFLVVRSGEEELLRRQLITEERLEDNDRYYLRKMPETASEELTERSEVLTMTEMSEWMEKKERAVGIVSGWKGSIPVKIEKKTEPGTDFEIFLEARSTEGIALHRTLFSGTGVISGGEQGIQGMQTGGFTVSDGENTVAIGNE